MFFPTKVRAGASALTNWVRCPGERPDWNFTAGLIGFTDMVLPSRLARKSGLESRGSTHRTRKALDLVLSQIQGFSLGPIPRATIAFPESWRPIRDREGLFGFHAHTRGGEGRAAVSGRAPFVRLICSYPGPGYNDLFRDECFFSCPESPGFPPIGQVTGITRDPRDLARTGSLSPGRTPRSATDRNAVSHRNHTRSDQIRRSTARPKL